jgi:hypothetical protein
MIHPLILTGFFAIFAGGLFAMGREFGPGYRRTARRP